MVEPKQHEIELPGCTPEPLMAYLKALGILRLVSEQADTEARGWWQRDVFWLRSKLDDGDLSAFLLSQYCPTPILAPWAGGSGFFKKDNKEATNSLCSSNSGRCKRFADAICQVRLIIDDEKIGEKPLDDDKARLIRRYRRELPDSVVEWMDAAMVIQSDSQSFAPLLGTGGNDGRLDFTQNFMQRLVFLGLHTTDTTSEQSRLLLAQSLFSNATALRQASVGQFSPGRAGGPNATQGTEGSATDNPWDFVLMMEGSLLFAGAAVRRLGSTPGSRATFPFTVRAVAAGFGSSSANDEADARGELWLPLWQRATTLADLRGMLSEGRSEVSGRVARNGAEFARAVAGLGVDRGIRAFTRIGLMKRSGKAFLATPIGRFGVDERVGVDLLCEIDPWLDRYRRAAADKFAPARFGQVLRALDSAVFDFCKYGGASFFQRILTALGAAERAMGISSRFTAEKKLTPIGGLTAEWATAANDGTPEFRLALALASIRDTEGKIGPLRANIEPFDWSKRYPDWAAKDRSVVWNGADLSANLAAVLARRVMDGDRKGCGNLPLAPASDDLGASPGDIAAFLAGEVDDDRVSDLLWGLMLVDPPHGGEMGGGIALPGDVQTVGSPGGSPAPHDTTGFPAIYSLLKLLFLPRPLVASHQGGRPYWRLARPKEPGTHRIRPEPAVLSLVRSGRVGEAAAIAMRRLRASGLTPLPHRRSGGTSRDAEWTGTSMTPRESQRLAAALLIPIHPSAANGLVRQATRSDDFDSQPTETIAAVAAHEGV